jgi:hypothetical protein
MPGSDFPLDEGEPQEGDGAARVPLSEAITAVLGVLTQCGGDLEAVRHRLRQEELPEELDVDEPELPRPAEQARPEPTGSSRPGWRRVPGRCGTPVER